MRGAAVACPWTGAAAWCKQVPVFLRILYISPLDTVHGSGNSVDVRGRRACSPSRLALWPCVDGPSYRLPNIDFGGGVSRTVGLGDWGVVWIMRLGVSGWEKRLSTV